MASRQEEKEARRKARLEAEAAAAKTASRQRRIQLVGGGVLAAVIVVGVVVAIVAGGGGGGGSDDAPRTSTNTSAKLPAQQTDNLAAAVKASGCTATSPAIEGRTHENKTFTEADYKTNPPTSGAHYPEWAQDGIYDPKNQPQLGEFVHTLEHGRIDVQYKPGTSKAIVDELEAFVNENQGYHMVMFQNQTGMDAQVALTAWGQSLTCNTISDKTWDAFRTFRDAHLDQGPEKIP